MSERDVLTAEERGSVESLLEAENLNDVRVDALQDIIDRLLGLLRPADPEAAGSWRCKAHGRFVVDPPQDCDWPFCGCDPHAEKVIEALQECGWSPPPAVEIGPRPAEPEAVKAIRERVKDPDPDMVLDVVGLYADASCDRAELLDLYDAQSRELAAARAIVARLEDDRLVKKVAGRSVGYCVKLEVILAYRARVLKGGEG